MQDIKLTIDNIPIKNPEISNFTFQCSENDFDISLNINLSNSENFEKVKNKIINNTIRKEPQKIYEDNDWEMKVHLEDFLKKVESLDRHSDEYEKLTKEFAQILRIQALNYGLVIPIEEFAQSVSNGSFISYDGVGYFLDENGTEIDSKCVPFNATEILKNKNKYKYVCWYNK
jgi:hypothetical protein